jgi:hypothetical protein
MEGKFQINPAGLYVNVNLGFGQSMFCKVNVVYPMNFMQRTFPQEFIHSHVYYPWPIEQGQTTQREIRRNYVFPAVLADTSNLKYDVNEHLTTLLDDRDNFFHFPLFNSPLKVLKTIYVFYESLNEVCGPSQTPSPTHTNTIRQSKEKQLLRKALKLLILIHIGGDISISSTTASNSILTQVFGYSVDASDFTPCFIRGQLGPVFQDLALGLMKDVLNELEFHCLSRKCGHFPLVVATFAVVFMAVESCQYHDAKDAFHAGFDHHVPSPSGPSVNVPALEESEGADALLKFYKACFAGCHRDTLLSVSQNAVSSSTASSTSGMNFVAGLKAAVEGVKLYLMEKSKVSVPAKGAADMTIFFDRLLAKLFLLDG